MEDLKFQDADSLGSYGGDKVSFREIIMNHLRKVSFLACVEFIGGYWTYKTITIGSPPDKVYVPDSRAIYSNSVECFADMLFPHFDSEMILDEAKAVKELVAAKVDIVKEEDYKDEVVKINRRLFRDLCSFLYRNNYLELGSLED